MLLTNWLSSALITAESMKFAKHVRFKVLKPCYVERVPEIKSAQQLVAPIIFIDKKYVTFVSSDAWGVAQYRPFNQL